MIVRCATSNAGKLGEFRLAGERSGAFTVEALPNLRDIAPPDENGATLDGRAPSEAPVPIGNIVLGVIASAVMRGLARRDELLNSSHQSSSRTCGHTPSIMNDF